MPRSTSGGGGRSSGSSHRSSSRSHGSSHRVSSSRGSSSRSSSSSRPRVAASSRGPSGHRPGPPVYVPFRGTGTATPLPAGRSGIGSVVFLVLIVIGILLLALSVSRSPTDSNSNIPASTAAREKLDLGYAFDANCVIDEIDWIDNESKLSGNLKQFYQKTGCQPYIYMKAYDPNCTTDDELEAWVQAYYDSTFQNQQHVVLYVYACETPNPADDTGNGWMNIQVGTQSALVMDAEAMDIFWAYLDADWQTWNPNDNDGMFADIFTRTANRIMQKTTTNKDLVKIGMILLGIICIIGGIIAFTVLKHKRAREEAQETIDILNAPIHTAPTEADDIAARYNRNDPNT